MAHYGLQVESRMGSPLAPGWVFDLSSGEISLAQALAQKPRGLILQSRQWPQEIPGMFESRSAPLALGIGCALEQPPNDEIISKWARAGARMLIWSAGPAECFQEDQGSKALRAGARAGMWNHLILLPQREHPLTRWALANPNQAHSWQTGEAWGSPSPSQEGPLAPPSGRPWWSLLSGLDRLLLQVQERGVRNLRTIWTSSQGEVYTLGGGVEYVFRKPGDITAPELKEISLLIEAGGGVPAKWVGRNLQRAFIVAVARERGRLIGTETLKHPRPEYIQAVREQTGRDLSDYLERGYIVVHPHFRGLGVSDRLVEGCLARAEGRRTYVVIASSNLETIELTKRHGSVLLATYRSQGLGQEVGLWTLDHEKEPPQEEGP